MPLADKFRDEIKRHMVTDRAGRNKTALIRSVYTDIVAAKDAGYSYVWIAKLLGDTKVLDIKGQHLATIVAQIEKQNSKKRAVKTKGTPMNTTTTDKPAAGKFKHDPRASGKELL